MTQRPTAPKPALPQQPPKIFWNWAEATVIGLLVLVGLELLLGLGLGVGLGLLNQAGVDSSAFSEGLETSITAQFIFLIIARVAALGVVFSFIKRRHVSLRRFGFKSFAPFKSMGQISLAMIGLFASSGVVFYLTQRILPALNLEQEQEILFTHASGYAELIMAFIALVIVTPVVEEVIFRGLLLPAYARAFGIVPAAIATSALFGAVHWQLNVGIITFIMGLFLAWLYYSTRSLWPAIIFHSLKNLLAFVLIFNLPT